MSAIDWAEYEREERIAEQRERARDLYDEWAAREEPDTDLDQQDELYERGAY